MYEIAAYFPERVRRAVASQVYDAGFSASGTFRRDMWQCCPLGAAFRLWPSVERATAPEDADKVQRVPAPISVAIHLVGVSGAEEWKAAMLASRFIEDWDKGVITDLAEALGVAE